MSVWHKAHDAYMRWIESETVQPSYTEQVTESLLKEL